MEGVIQVLGFLRPESRALDELIAGSDQVRFSVDRLLLHSVLLISHCLEARAPCGGFARVARREEPGGTHAKVCGSPATKL